MKIIISGAKKKKKHKKKLKRKRSTDFSDSSNSDEPKVKVKRELTSPESSKRNKSERGLNFKIDHPQTVFDLVSDIVSKKERNDNEFNDIKPDVLKSPELPPISKKVDDESEPIVPRLLGNIFFYTFLKFD